MKPKKEPKQESQAFFEMQEDAWFENDCQGNIEDYDGTEFPEYSDFERREKMNNRGEVSM